MYWDDQENPSVEAPLAAFFGFNFYRYGVDRDGVFPTLNSAMLLVALFGKLHRNGGLFLRLLRFRSGCGEFPEISNPQRALRRYVRGHGKA